MITLAHTFNITWLLAHNNRALLDFEHSPEHRVLKDGLERPWIDTVREIKLRTKIFLSLLAPPCIALLDNSGTLPYVRDYFFFRVRWYQGGSSK
jgi:hypothetical protein